MRSIVKRLIDIFGSAVALLLFAPILIITGIAVYASMGSPIFFTQVRPGLGGKPFKIYKFRTMHGLTDKQGNLLPDDVRLTRVGRFIRHWSLDELPQFWNVIKGDMSLVGPRPTLMRYVNNYTPEQARRFDVKPGITGLAQVMGRNSLLFSERLKYDIEYVNNYCTLLDLKIIALTAYKVLFNRLEDRAGQDVALVDDIGITQVKNYSPEEQSLSGGSRNEHSA